MDKRTSEGFTLLELMITVFILAIGLLGLASLQTLSLQHNSNAFYRSTAVHLANQMADNIRANQRELSTYISTTKDGSLDFSCVNKSCSAQKMAQYDTKAWSKALKNQLPNGSGVIAQNGKFVEISVNWSERQLASNAKKEDVTKTHKVMLQI